MILNDFISKLPIEIIIKTKILDTKIILPIKVDPIKFYEDFSVEIKTEQLTPEKAIFVASLVDRQPYLTSFDILTSKLVF